MADRIVSDTSPSMSSLLGGIVSDIQALVRQEIALAKTEMLREWEKAKAWLRDRGVAIAATKGGRVAKDGLVSSYIHAGGKLGASQGLLIGTIGRVQVPMGDVEVLPISV